MCCWWPNANVKLWATQLQKLTKFWWWAYKFVTTFDCVGTKGFHFFPNFKWCDSHIGKPLTFNTKECHIVISTNYFEEALMQVLANKLEIIFFVVVDIMWWLIMKKGASIRTLLPSIIFSPCVWDRDVHPSSLLDSRWI